MKTCANFYWKPFDRRLLFRLFHPRKTEYKSSTENGQNLDGALHVRCFCINCFVVCYRRVSCVIYSIRILMLNDGYVSCTDHYSGSSWGIDFLHHLSHLEEADQEVSSAAMPLHVSASTNPILRHDTRNTSLGFGSATFYMSLERKIISGGWSSSLLSCIPVITDCGSETVFDRMISGLESCI